MMNDTHNHNGDWMEFKGQDISIQQYPELHDALKQATTFALPDNQHCHVMSDVHTNPQPKPEPKVYKVPFRAPDHKLRMLEA